MFKKLLAVVGVVVLLAGCAAFGPAEIKQVTGRSTLPELTDGDMAPIMCPTGVVLRVGFDEKDGRYTLMFFGDADQVGEKLVPRVPHVWMRFEGATSVAILLVDVDGKPRVVTPDELRAKYPNPCALLGTPA